MSWASFRTEGTEAAYEVIPETGSFSSTNISHSHGQQSDHTRTRNANSVSGGGARVQAAKKVFGKMLMPEDLEPVAIAVPLREHISDKRNELNFLLGETMRVLATKAFVPQVCVDMSKESARVGRERVCGGVGNTHTHSCTLMHTHAHTCTHARTHMHAH